MPSLHHGAIFIGAFLIVTGGSTAFLASYQSRLQAFSLCCVVLGVVMLILGLFWAMNSGADLDYPPMDSGGLSPAPRPPPWLEPPPPYEVAIKTTCSSTHLRRAYSDTHLATEPLFGQSREISFEV
uniref:Si:dkeyp-51f12.2 n=1 Tax=Cyprinodon variegatus TaxID=28743 RepID=A0A3Q2CCX0_CYPVA